MRCLLALGEIARYEGNDDEAIRYYSDALAIARELGDNRRIAMCAGNLSFALMHVGDYARAKALIGESLMLNRGMGIKAFSVGNLEEFAWLAAAVKEPVRAARLLGAAEHLAESIGLAANYFESPADEAERKRNLALVRAQLDEAAFNAAWVEGRQLTPEQAMAEGLRIEVPAGPPVPLTQPTTVSAPTTVEVKPAPLPKPAVEVLPLRVCALGPVQVYRGEQVLGSPDWTYAKSRELLFFLLCHPAQTREQIGLALWPDASTNQLRSNFGAIMHYLRRALGSADWVVFENERYAFNRALSYWFDVEAFEASVSAARHALGAGSANSEAGSLAITHLEQAVGLYRGDFLSDQTVGDWPMARQEELRRAYLEALLTLGGLYQEQRRFADAVGIYQRAIAQDSYLEAAHRELMRSLARQGERAQALRQYQHLVELLRAELHSAPARETTRLHERVQRGDDL